jgi:hypothetical protein
MKTATFTTSSVQALMGRNEEFSSIVRQSMIRFMRNDWGDTQDKELNDSDPMFAMGSYPAPCDDGKIWIKSDDYSGADPKDNPEGYGRVLTVMFPSEY